MWGMTETSPLGSLGAAKRSQLEGGLSAAELRDLKLSQGRPHAFIDFRLVDDAGRELPRDGRAVGRLQVRARRARGVVGRLGKRVVLRPAPALGRRSSLPCHRP